MIDFVTALARLLRDPLLREAFARDPADVAGQLDVRAADRPAFERLDPGELEAQAHVLIRKRFREAVALLPSTCATLGGECWPLFCTHARDGWPVNASADALAFCVWLDRRGKRVSEREHNRLRFAVGAGRFALHLVTEPSPLIFPRGQILFRRGRRISELSLRLGW